eukprot:TRINITY_DN1347_c0_g1_i3.p1 TRINITY_DN1347_c0_g1~~TRINITY_DN1347_c0_g1_i3.p1  ORF type:complete len:251 (-),score=43.21 TRINITY_DN1347_c0_g1_i3:494-1246(-)
MILSSRFFDQGLRLFHVRSKDFPCCCRMFGAKQYVTDPKQYPTSAGSSRHQNKTGVEKKDISRGSSPNLTHRRNTNDELENRSSESRGTGNERRKYIHHESSSQKGVAPPRSKAGTIHRFGVDQINESSRSFGQSNRRGHIGDNIFHRDERASERKPIFQTGPQNVYSTDVTLVDDLSPQDDVFTVASIPQINPRFRFPQEDDLLPDQPSQMVEGSEVVTADEDVWDDIMDKETYPVHQNFRKPSKQPKK